jgi:hypothetical protein
MEKTKSKKPVGRRIVKRTAPGPAGGIELLKLADKLDLQRYAAEGLDKKGRALTALKHLQDGQMTYKKFTPEDHIFMCRFIREKKAMDEDAIFAFIACLVEEITWEDAELNRLYNASEAKHKEAGFIDDESWPEDNRPADVQKLFDAYWDRFLHLRVAILRHHDEGGMADFLLNDPDAYQERIDKGKKMLDKKGIKK